MTIVLRPQAKVQGGGGLCRAGRLKASVKTALFSRCRSHLGPRHVPQKVRYGPQPGGGPLR